MKFMQLQLSCGSPTGCLPACSDLPWSKPEEFVETLWTKGGLRQLKMASVNALSSSLDLLITGSSKFHRRSRRRARPSDEMVFATPILWKTPRTLFSKEC
jgi:hypothetical protein